MGTITGSSKFMDDRLEEIADTLQSMGEVLEREHNPDLANVCFMLSEVAMRLYGHAVCAKDIF